jgi:small subunit ribosomal protein S16
MAVVIRLKRLGTKKKPAFRIVVTDSRFPRDGRFIESIGSYDPSRNPVFVSVNRDRALYWLKTGSKASCIVSRIFKKEGIA